MQQNLAAIKIGQAARSLRLEREMSQRQVGAIARLDHSVISEFERGIYPARLDHVEAIAGVFEVSFLELVAIAFQ